MIKVNKITSIEDRPKCGCGNRVQLKEYRGERPVWKSRCSSCTRKGRRTKKDHCELCGFIAKDPVQLDVDHINGISFDNRPENLQTICANCHRLKTKQNQEWNNRYEEVQ